MATKLKPTKAVPPSVLSLGLGDPGMTPLLRAGLGGLAASLRAILLASEPGARWPSPVPLAGGRAVVEPTRITLEWGDSSHKEVLKALFAGSFRIHPPGVIELPGASDPNKAFDLALATALQTGLKKTFLQHPKSTTKAGAALATSVEIDGQPIQLQVHPYATFVHQKQGLVKVCEAISGGTVALAGWAYPGAAVRHVGFSNDTTCEYSAAAALAACFSLVGCLSYQLAPGNGGVLVILEPNDLVRFATTRARLSPQRVIEASVTGPGEAVLRVHLAMKLDDVARDRPGVACAHGVMLKPMPWDQKQKYRIATVSASEVPADRLDAYHDIVTALPNRIATRALDEDDGDEDGFFVATSDLRAFVAENLARGRRWFRGFATATTGGKRPRFIHYFRAEDGKNLGALYPKERKGLIAMLQHLDNSEEVLVRAVQVALRRRFGAIADECRNLPDATRNKRFDNERERWRYAFARSKTPQQIRAALADLWSRAGFNAELQARWPEVLPLLRADNWETARDLALVALASYQGTETASGDETSS